MASFKVVLLSHLIVQTAISVCKIELPGFHDKKVLINMENMNENYDKIDNNLEQEVHIRVL